MQLTNLVTPSLYFTTNAPPVTSTQNAQNPVPLPYFPGNVHAPKPADRDVRTHLWRTCMKLCICFFCMWVFFTWDKLLLRVCFLHAFLTAEHCMSQFSSPEFFTRMFFYKINLQSEFLSSDPFTTDGFFLHLSFFSHNACFFSHTLFCRTHFLWVALFLHLRSCG